MTPAHREGSTQQPQWGWVRCRIATLHNSISIKRPEWLAAGLWQPLATNNREDRPDPWQCQHLIV